MRLEKTIWLRTMAALTVLIAMNFLAIFHTGLGRLSVLGVVLSFFGCGWFFKTLRPVRPLLPVALLAGLAVFATPGLAYNKMLRMESGMSTTVLLSVIVLHAQFLPRSVMQLDPVSWLRSVQWFGTLFCGCSLLGLAYAHYVDGTRIFFTAHHECSFLIPIGTTAAYLRRRKVGFVANALLAAAVVAADPRSTMVIVIVVSLFLIAAASTPRPVFKMIVAGVVGFAALSSGLLYGEIKNFNRNFKEGRTGSGDNSAFRERLNEYGLSKFYESPVFGDFFSGPTMHENVLNKLYDESGYLLDSHPLHNDFLQVAVSGGLVGLALFAGAFVSCVAMGFTTYYDFRDRSLYAYSDLTLLFTLTLFNAIPSMAVNPVINSINDGFFVYAFFAGVVIMRRVYLHQFSKAPGRSFGRRSALIKRG